MAKQVKRTVSYQSENMTKGRADDFDGKIVGGGFKFHEFQKGKRAGQVGVIAFVDYEPSEESGFEPFRQYIYNLGFEVEKYFAPSLDGVTPIEQSEYDSSDEHSGEGPHLALLDEDNPKRLAGNSQFGFYLDNLEKCGFDRTLIDGDDGFNSIADLEGHFNVLSPPARPGKVKEGEEGKKAFDDSLLVPTSLGKKKKGAKAAPPAKGKAAAAAADDDDDDDNDDDAGEERNVKLDEAIKAALAAFPNNTAPTIQKLSSKVLALYKGKDKNEAVASIPEIIAGVPGVKFNKKTGASTLIEEDED